MRIYKLDTVFGKRDTVFTEPWPSEPAVVIADFWKDEITRFVSDYFYGKTTIFGITRDFAKLYIYYWFLKYWKVQGFGVSGAFVLAREHFKYMMAQRASAAGWFAIGLAAGVVLLGLCFAIADWTEKDEGRWDFPDGAVIMRYQERLWWAGLVGHPTSLEWDFQQCREIGEQFFWERRMQGDGFGNLDFWDFDEAWEAKEKKFVGWYVYRFGQMRVYYLGVAHNRGWGRYRLRLAEDNPPPYERPIGWGIREFYACEFVREFAKLWVG